MTVRHRITLTTGERDRFGASSRAKTAVSPRPAESHWHAAA